MKDKQHAASLSAIIIGFFLVFLLTGLLHGISVRKSPQRLISIASSRIEIKPLSDFATVADGTAKYELLYDCGQLNAIAYNVDSNVVLVSLPLQAQDSYEINRDEYFRSLEELGAAGMGGYTAWTVKDAMDYVGEATSSKLIPSKVKTVLIIAGAAICGYSVGYWAGTAWDARPNSNTMREFLSDKRNWPSIERQVWIRHYAELHVNYIRDKNNLKWSMNGSIADSFYPQPEKLRNYVDSLVHKADKVASKLENLEYQIASSDFQCLDQLQRMVPGQHWEQNFIYYSLADPAEQAQARDSWSKGMHFHFSAELKSYSWGMPIIRTKWKVTNGSAFAPRP